MLRKQCEPQRVVRISLYIKWGDAIKLFDTGVQPMIYGLFDDGLRLCELWLEGGGPQNFWDTLYF